MTKSAYYPMIDSEIENLVNSIRKNLTAIELMDNVTLNETLAIKNWLESAKAGVENAAFYVR